MTSGSTACFWMVCTWFNEDRILQRAASGLLIERIRRSSLAQSRPDLAPGTLSQIVAYVDSSGKAVAIAHRYRQPDGSVGASGNHEPKWLLRHGISYRPAHDYRQACADCPVWRPRAEQSAGG